VWEALAPDLGFLLEDAKRMSAIRNRRVSDAA